jgi:hypothetical protein
MNPSEGVSQGSRPYGWKGATRFFGNVCPLSGTRFPKNQLQRIPPRTGRAASVKPATTPFESSSSTGAERRPSRVGRLSAL